MNRELIVFNADIKSINIGFEHGCLTMEIWFNYGDRESVPMVFLNYGYQLDEKNKLAFCIGRILKTLEADKLDDLIGEPVRIRKIDPTGSEDHAVRAIGHFRKNNWFFIQDELNAAEAKVKEE